MEGDIELIPSTFDINKTETYEWLPAIKAVGKDSYKAEDNFFTNNKRNAICGSLYLQLVEQYDKTAAAANAPWLYLDAKTKVTTAFSYLCTGTLENKILLSNRLNFSHGGKPFGYCDDFSSFIRKYEGPKFVVAFVDSCSAYTTIENGIAHLLQNMRTQSVLMVEISSRPGGASDKFPEDSRVIEHSREQLFKKITEAGFKYRDLSDCSERIRNMHCIVVRLLKTDGKRGANAGWLDVDLPWAATKDRHTHPISYFFNHPSVKPRIPDKVWKALVIHMPQKVGYDWKMDDDQHLDDRVKASVKELFEQERQNIIQDVVQKIPQKLPSNKKRERDDEAEASAKDFIRKNYVFFHPARCNNFKDMPKSHFTTLPQVYAEYAEWANTNNVQLRANNVFSKDIKAVCLSHGFDLVTGRTKRKQIGKQVQCFRNMRHKSIILGDEQQDDDDGFDEQEQQDTEKAVPPVKIDNNIYIPDTIFHQNSLFLTDDDGCVSHLKVVDAWFTVDTGNKIEIQSNIYEFKNNQELNRPLLVYRKTLKGLIERGQYAVVSICDTEIFRYKIMLQKKEEEEVVELPDSE